MLSKLSSPEIPPNISCTCTECTTFLRPSFASKSHFPRNFSHSVLPATNTLPHAQAPTCIDKLSLAAYDAQTITSVTVPPVTKVLNRQRQLSVITSTIHTMANIRSAFPKTPGTFWCSNPHCRTRVPVVSRLTTTTGSRARPLCDEHSERSFEVDRSHGPVGRYVAFSKGTDISETMDLYQPTGVESRWGSNDRDGAGKPELGPRISPLASRESLGSWESDNAEFVWDAKAFDSKLCW